MYTDALAQEAARARDATLHARIAIDVAAGNKLVYTIPKAAPGKEAGSFGLAAKVTDLVDLSEYEIRRLATMGRNDIELQRLGVAEASSMLVDTHTKQKASKPSRTPRSRPEAMPSLVRLRRSGRKRSSIDVGGSQEAGSPGAGDKGHTKAKRGAMPAESLPEGRDNATSSHDIHDMPDTAFGVQHLAAIQALRDSGAPVNYGSVIRESMCSTLNHGPPPPYDPATDTPAHHAWESAVRRRHVLQMLDRMYPDSHADA